MAVAVRVINIFSTKYNCFSVLVDVTKNYFFSHVKEGGAEILPSEISDLENSILLPEF